MTPQGLKQEIIPQINKYKMTPNLMTWQDDGHYLASNALCRFLYSSERIGDLGTFFNVEDNEKTKSGLTYGWSCQIHNQSDQSFVPLIS